ncbi:hypothetical protein PG994_000991 [Apiospora phragmitis]|uniref:Uncharacterized protein n=1 Tax=Apiospora phragmitis TaxID=2905665 RepID=A0ABR1WRQ8_9PEZI
MSPDHFLNNVAAEYQVQQGHVHMVIPPDVVVPPVQAEGAGFMNQTGQSVERREGGVPTTALLLWRPSKSIIFCFTSCVMTPRWLLPASWRLACKDRTSSGKQSRGILVIRTIRTGFSSASQVIQAIQRMGPTPFRPEWRWRAGSIKVVCLIEMLGGCAVCTIGLHDSEAFCRSVLHYCILVFFSARALDRFDPAFNHVGIGHADRLYSVFDERDQ